VEVKDGETTVARYAYDGTVVERYMYDPYPYGRARRAD
jgi:hypothetical protein